MKTVCKLGILAQRFGLRLTWVTSVLLLAINIYPKLNQTNQFSLPATTACFYHKYYSLIFKVGKVSAYYGCHLYPIWIIIKSWSWIAGGEVFSSIMQKVVFYSKKYQNTFTSEKIVVYTGIHECLSFNWLTKKCW